MTVNGVSGRSANWSLGGMALRYDDIAAAGLEADMTVSGNLGPAEQDSRYDFEGRVVRIDSGRNEVAVEFSRLSQSAIMLFIDEFRDMIGGAA